MNPKRNFTEPCKSCGHRREVPLAFGIKKMISKAKDITVREGTDHVGLAELMLGIIEYRDYYNETFGKKHNWPILYEMELPSKSHILGLLKKNAQK